MRKFFLWLAVVKKEVLWNGKGWQNGKGCEDGFCAWKKFHWLSLAGLVSEFTKIAPFRIVVVAKRFWWLGLGEREVAVVRVDSGRGVFYVRLMVNSWCWLIFGCWLSHARNPGSEK